MTSPVLDELREVVRIGLPMAGTQLGFMLLGVVDTMMLGHVDAVALAAGGAGNMWHWAWVSFGLGVVLGIEPLISQAHGRRQPEVIALCLQRGVIVACLVSVPLIVIQCFTGPFLELLGQDPKVSEGAHIYNLWRLPAIPGFLLFIVLRVYLQGRGIVAPALGVAVIGNVFNVIFDWLLIFGFGPIPALGLQGAAIASTITAWTLPLGLLLWTKWAGHLRGYWRPWDERSFDRRGLRQIVRLGVPIGFQTAVEAWAFSMAMFMAGWLGIEALASHQIAMNLTALSFMVPLGIAIGTATRVGNLIGEADLAGARRATWLGLGLAAAYGLAAGAAFVLLRHHLPALFTEDTRVVLLAATVLPLAAAFQLFDATQAVAGGVLRGMGRPRAAAWIHTLGFFACGLPLAYILAFQRGAGLLGIWTALFVALGVVCLGVCIWVARTARLPLEQLSVHAES